MAVTSVSVILTVFVLKLHHCGPHQAEVPPWIRKWILDYLARAVRCQCALNSRKKVKSKKHHPQNHYQQQYYYAPPKAKKHSSEDNNDVCLRLVEDQYLSRNARRASPVVELRNSDRFLRHANNIASTNSHNNSRTSRSSPTRRRDTPSSVSSGNIKALSDYSPVTEMSSGRYRESNDVNSPEIKRLGVMEEILKYLKVKNTSSRDG